MRHNKRVTHLGRTTSHKKAMMRNMAAQVFQHKEIRTTEARAKELRRVVDRLITYGKRGTLHHRRLAFNFLRSKEAVTRLFDEIAPTYDERPGGYTRIVKLGFRKGDSAPISLIQLVGFEAAGEKRKKKSEKKETAKKETASKKKEEKKPEETRQAEETVETEETVQAEQAAETEETAASAEESATQPEETPDADQEKEEDKKE